eukprot:Hpha_TRINITY_DN28545_c0_g1::TRINITY_DN28545_c0_g1_i1::g.18594::m.18594/K01069/E3.1.2.6, gloB; hydroxyacylglutathione hydrolase
MRKGELQSIVHAAVSFVIFFYVLSESGLLAAGALVIFGSQLGLLQFFPLLYFIYCNQVTGPYVARLLHRPQPEYHSVPQKTVEQGIEVFIVPVLADNYSYVIVCQETKKAAVVDPGDADPVLKVLKANPDVEVEKILVTHKHWDHCGGAAELKAALSPTPRVFGSEGGAYGMTDVVKGGEVISVGNREVRVARVPGHTKEHICFAVRGKEGKEVLFTGDSLFCGGCGAFFEAEACDLKVAHEFFESLPEDTMIFPGHEYTVLLLEREAQRDPNNEVLKEQLNQANRLRVNQYPTVPSVLSVERKINPFLRLTAQFLGQAKEANQVMMEMSKAVKSQGGAPADAPVPADAPQGAS